MAFKVLMIIIGLSTTLAFTNPQMRPIVARSSIEALNRDFGLCARDRAAVDQRNAQDLEEEEEDDAMADEISLFMSSLSSLDGFLEERKSFLFSYADLTKIRDETALQPIGWFFLATNVAYILSGLLVSLSSETNVVAAASIQLAGLLSFTYHFLQIRLGPNRIEVRRSLLVDYAGAFSAGILCSLDALSFLMNVPVDFVTQTGGVLVLALVSLAALVRSALYYDEDQCLEYVFWHSLWHFLSALTAYYVASI